MANMVPSDNIVEVGGLRFAVLWNGTAWQAVEAQNAKEYVRGGTHSFTRPGFPLPRFELVLNPLTRGYAVHTS
ncbi:MAG: hypothetical protein JNM07_02590 [Phycisphaerae bacterium]|nr:hypothetical protein [Phycisphaerae bacterium]